MARWLGDIRACFPSTVVQVMQKDALERLDLTRMLLEPEMLEAVEPDVHLVGTLLSLSALAVIMVLVIMGTSRIQTLLLGRAFVPAAVVSMGKSRGRVSAASTTAL